MPGRMRAYIVNLDSAPQRWAFMERAFERTSVSLERIPAVDGSRLSFPCHGFSEERFRRWHGRTTNPREIGCYLSHIRAMETFLASGDPYGLICEDDLILKPGFEEVLARALSYARHWNILRLTGLGTGHAAKVAPLAGEYWLCVNFGRMKGAGMYLVDRKAAKAFVNRLLPMWLPYDHAFDREWCFGLRAASVLPFPVSQCDSGLRSSIQGQSGRKLPRLNRYATTYPYQTVNELSRWATRSVCYLSWKLRYRKGALPPAFDAGTPDQTRSARPATPECDAHDAQQ